MDPLEDRQQQLHRDQRPLRKQSMALGEERMMIQPLWDELEMKREPIEEARREYENTAWKEL